MLDFWYSERCTRQIKLLLCIVVCIAIYYCSSIQKLSVLFSGFSLAIGILIHLFRTWLIKVDQNNPYRQGFSVLFTSVPIILSILIICLLPSNHKIYLAVQSVGFICLGLFIVSLYENRSKRNSF